MPIILIVISSDCSQSFWSEFDIENTTPSASGWWIEIDKNSKLDITVKESWSKLAGEAQDYSEEIKNIWAISKELNNCSFLAIAIPKSDVISESLSHLNLVLKKITKNKQLIISKRSSIEIFFPEYDLDPRELYDIPEMRVWFKKTIAEGIPWFYFLENNLGIGLMVLLYCTCQVKLEKIQDNKHSLSICRDDLGWWLERNFENLNYFTEANDISLKVNIVLITGSTDGIGKLTGIKLAQQGHEVYLHGRSSEKLSTVISQIKEKTKNGNIKGFVADFSDLDEVKQMAHQVKEELSQIDVLINNAGVYNSNKSQNNNGLNMRFVVNYLAPFLLTNELIPLLKQGEKSRVINLSSAAQSSIDYEVLTGVETRSQGETYAQSKLALTMWSFYLAKREPDINAIAVNPGSLLNTKMVKEAFSNYWSPADKGAKILYELAISDDYQDASGKYFDNDKGAFAKAHPDVYNEKKIDKLIATTIKILAN